MELDGWDENAQSPPPDDIRSLSQDELLLLHERLRSRYTDIAQRRRVERLKERRKRKETLEERREAAEKLLLDVENEIIAERERRSVELRRKVRQQHRMRNKREVREMEEKEMERERLMGLGREESIRKQEERVGYLSSVNQKWKKKTLEEQLSEVKAKKQRNKPRVQVSVATKLFKKNKTEVSDEQLSVPLFLTEGKRGVSGSGIIREFPDLPALTVDMSERSKDTDEMEQRIELLRKQAERRSAMEQMGERRDKSSEESRTVTKIYSEKVLRSLTMREEKDVEVEDWNGEVFMTEVPRNDEEDENLGKESESEVFVEERSGDRGEWNGVNTRNLLSSLHVLSRKEYEEEVRDENGVVDKLAANPFLPRPGIPSWKERVEGMVGNGSVRQWKRPGIVRKETGSWRHMSSLDEHNTSDLEEKRALDRERGKIRKEFAEREKVQEERRELIRTLLRSHHNAQRRGAGEMSNAFLGPV